MVHRSVRVVVMEVDSGTLQERVTAAATLTESKATFDDGVTELRAIIDDGALSTRLPAHHARPSCSTCDV